MKLKIYEHLNDLKSISNDHNLTHKQHSIVNKAVLSFDSTITLKLKTDALDSLILALILQAFKQHKVSEGGEVPKYEIKNLLENALNYNYSYILAEITSILVDNKALNVIDDQEKYRYANSEEQKTEFADMIMEMVNTYKMKCLWKPKI
jgi:hypothetical protein